MSKETKDKKKNKQTENKKICVPRSLSGVSFHSRVSAGGSVGCILRGGNIHSRHEHGGEGKGEERSGCGWRSLISFILLIIDNLYLHRKSQLI